MLPMPISDKDERNRFERSVRDGGLHVVRSGGLSEMGGPRDPTSRWTPASYGPAPTPGHVDLRREAARDVLAACGIPATLFDRQADGTAMRESYRRLIFTTVQPWAALVQGELQDKLDSPELRISFAGLHGADLATRGRALKQLTESGESLADAMAITGLAEGA